MFACQRASCTLPSRLLPKTLKKKKDKPNGTNIADLHDSRVPLVVLRKSRQTTL
jgi:hypothetical protein